MRAVVQRVASASVTVGDRVVGAIAKGLLVYLGIGNEDVDDSVDYTAEKIVGLRVFADDAGKMNRSVKEAAGAILVVSQFTLYGDVRRGRRPAFDQAMEPTRAEAMYRALVDRIRETGIQTETGEFRADMLVDAKVDGPITILIDSARLF